MRRKPVQEFSRTPLVLLENRSRVECYIRDGNKPDIWNTQAFQILERQQEQIHQSFGDKLIWDDLPGRKGCRISYEIDGGWKTVPEAWPQLQDKLIQNLIRFEAALAKPVKDINI